MRFLTKKKVFELIFLFVISLFPLLWFSPGHMVLGADSGYPIDFITYFHQRLFTWFSSQNFGVDYTPVIGQLTLIGVPALVAFLGVAVTSVQKITFVLWFFLMNLSMYSLATYIFPESKQWRARLICCLIYTYNFYLLPFLWQGAQTTFSAYIFFPLFTLIFLSFLQKKLSLLSAAIILNLVYFIFNSGAVHGVPLLGPPIVVFIVFSFVFFIISIKKDRFTLVKNIFLFLFFSVVIGFILNAYWLIPFLLQFQERFNSGVSAVNGIEGTVTWARMISDHASFLNLSRLQGDRAWYTTPDFYSLVFLENPLLILVSFLFAIFTFGSYFLIQTKRDRLIVTLFICLSLVGFFFAMGVRDPLGQLYVLLMQHLPGFIAFRSPYYKFTPLIIFSSGILVAFSVQKVSEKLDSLKGNAFVVGVLILIIAYHFPYFQKENLVFIKPYSTMVQVPDYIQEFAAYKNAMKNDDGRTLVLPPLNSGFSIPVAYTWKYLGFYSLFSGLSDHSFVFNHSDLTDEEKIPVYNIYNALRNKQYEDFTNMAGRLGITHILLTKDTAYKNTIAPSENPRFFEKILSSSQFIKKWGNGKWEYFEIKNLAPHTRIRAVTIASLLKGNFSDMDMGILENKDFIVENQSEKNIIKILPFAESYERLLCRNCKSFQESAEVTIPEITVPSLRFLYELKLEREKGQEAEKRSNSQQLDFYLGSSIKRLGEIRGLELQKNIVPSMQPDIAVPIALLYKNAQHINKLTEGMPKSIEHLDELSRVYEYEKAILQGVSALLEENASQVQAQRKKLFSVKSETLKTIDDLSMLGQYLAEKKLVFTIPLKTQNGIVEIPTSSLPKKLDQTPILPQITNDKGEVFIAQQHGKYLTLNPRSSDVELTLLFPDIPNMTTLMKEDKITIDGRYKNCLRGNIRNYHWSNSYLITSDIASDADLSSIYIDLHDGRSVSGDISPDMSYTFAKGEERVRKFYNTTNPTANATVYFCTDTSLDPEKIFSNPKVEEIFLPQLFLHSNTLTPIAAGPKIKYQIINPTKYVVHVEDVNAPFLLLFSDRFSSLWKATISGEALVHFKSNGYANGWYVPNKKGNFDILLNFSSQKIFERASALSMLGIICVCLYVIYRYRKRKK